MIHTVESVKRDLPSVKLCNQERVYDGILLSGQGEMARVGFGEKEVDIPAWLLTRQLRFPWHWVAHALNEDRPLQI